MAGNPWDYSQILLSNNAGANIGRGIEQAGRGFAKGIEAWAQAEEKRKKEEATVEWLESTPEAVNALFPKLAQVQDPAERKKAIKAGIKGAGLENVMQVQGYMEQRKRQAAQDRINAEMAKLNMTGQDLRNQGAARDLMQAETNDRALRMASAPAAGMADQIAGGAGFRQLDPNAEADPAAIFMRQGGNDPRMIQSLTRSRPFVPQEMMTPSGVTMLQTSPNSWIPSPRERAKPVKAPGAATGPEYSKDRKFYRNGPDDQWRQVAKSGSSETKLDPVTSAQLQSLPAEIAKLEQEISEQAKELAAGDERTWIGRSRDGIVAKKQAELAEKKRQLNELRGRAGMSADEPAAAADGPKVVTDPFSYVMGI